MVYMLYLRLLFLFTHLCCLGNISGRTFFTQVTTRKEEDLLYDVQRPSGFISVLNFYLSMGGGWVALHLMIQGSFAMTRWN